MWKSLLNFFKSMMLFVCLCEDAYKNNVRIKMEEIGHDIAYKNRYGLRRFKAGGLLIAVKNYVKLS